LFKDYDRFKPRLRKLGHNISKVAEETLAAYGLKPMRPSLAKELGQLEVLYSRHLLRYGNGYDILVSPLTIERDRVFHRMAACFHLADRELRRAFPTP
jgi:hypothetical protein